MGLIVKVGDVYTEIKRGTSAKGEYAFAIARAEKGTDRISVFFDNISDIPETAYAVKVDEIKDVSISAKQINGNWYKNYSITAKVSSVEGGAVETNPFEDGSVPF